MDGKLPHIVFVVFGRVIAQHAGSRGLALRQTPVICLRLSYHAGFPVRRDAALRVVVLFGLLDFGTGREMLRDEGVEQQAYAQYDHQHGHGGMQTAPPLLFLRFFGCPGLRHRLSADTIETQHAMFHRDSPAFLQVGVRMGYACDGCSASMPKSTRVGQSVYAPMKAPEKEKGIRRIQNPWRIPRSADHGSAAVVQARRRMMEIMPPAMSSTPATTMNTMPMPPVNGSLPL